MTLPEVVSLEVIQGLVDQLQQKILKNPSQADWQRDWGQIKYAIGHYDGLARAEDRKRLGYRMHERLDSLGFQGSEPPPIRVEAEVKKIIANPEAWKMPKTKWDRFPY